MSGETTINNGKPIGALEQLTVADTAIALASVPLSANRAVIVCQDAQVRFTDDGSTTPTSTVGMPLEQTQSYVLESAEALANFKAIRTGGTSAILNISYYFRE